MDSELVKRVKSELGIDVDKKIRKHISEKCSPNADGYERGMMYQRIALEELTNQNKTK